MTQTTTTIVCNWSTIDQELIHSSEAEQEAFVAAARSYAAANGFGFDTIRDIQRPGFYLTTGEYDAQRNSYPKSDDLDDEAAAIFDTLCAQI